MARYLIRRLVSGLVILFVFQTIMFFAIQIILPGDFVSHSFGLSPAMRNELRASMGLDLPLGERYLHWISSLARGDLGRSYTIQGQGQPVMEVLLNALPVTILLFGIGTALAFLIGLWLGKVTAWRKRSLLTSATTFGSILLYTSFPPWLSFLLAYFLMVRLGLFVGLQPRDPSRRPVSGQVVSEAMWQAVGALVVVVIVLLVANALLWRLRRRRIPTLLFVILAAGLWAASWQALGLWNIASVTMYRMTLPILAFTLLSFGEIMLIMRTNMADTLHEQYIHTARAKGLPDRDIRDRHAARNALLPVISRLVISLPYLLTGMVMVEESFSWQGVGTMLFYALGWQNIPLALGSILVIGVFVVVIRIVLDVLVALLDPRVRFSGRAGAIG